MTAWMPENLAARLRVNARFCMAAALIIVSVGTALPGMAAPNDTDNDAIANSTDNCTLAFNPSQLDSDHDGNGNACDGDLDNNGMVSAPDYILLQSVFNLRASSSGLAAAADFDGNGTVGVSDMVRVRSWMGEHPGRRASSHRTYRIPREWRWFPGCRQHFAPMVPS
jgi:hypothetical protein